MTKHPNDRRQRLTLKKQKYEDKQEAKQAEAIAPNSIRKRKTWLKLKEAEDDLRRAYGGTIER